MAGGRGGRGAGLGEKVIAGNLSCAVLERKLVRIRLQFEYSLIKMLPWLNGNFSVFLVFLVCAICDDRQHICEDLGRLGHFSVLIYVCMLILEVFSLKLPLRCRPHFMGKPSCVLLSMQIGPQIYLLGESLCRLDVGAGDLVAGRLLGLGGPYAGMAHLPTNGLASSWPVWTC